MTGIAPRWHGRRDTLSFSSV
ncbi:hypothetical protein CBM2633_A50477 [Cupriavidus taiwanensis]|uniref:Uncharacterized protein n=1 Tax=Cupriavidus taiwanensis TaxID=164546 RepID=A0A375DZ23_9BURK|nr:hypothetical protein CBM2604_A60302 [Cupriavidus taiwanensis]SOZ29011.1 hypothetical protein CBM2609_A70304 [Cupriavidus taiwanensis]SOZ46471.1 hypothetical protein CBM2610_A80258 [Cupriavidus taiwanensis]SOZ50962.1 hypothetical protein CBM2614_A130133 [Cupriavidus taiwanensis]SOZ53599.1 hypothetical protein CBM2613_A130132 [Cupriavidus taiwanensis]